MTTGSSPQIEEGDSTATTTNTTTTTTTNNKRSLEEMQGTQNNTEKEQEQEQKNQDKGEEGNSSDNKDNKDGKQKQQNNNNNKKGGRKGKNNNKKKQKVKVNTTWRDDDPKNLYPHEGSYASATMREKFGIVIEGYPEKKKEDKKDEKKKEEDEKENTTNTSSNNNNNASSSNRPKGSKRKVACLVGYIGSDYDGFQINPGIKTIQAQMELALFYAKVIHPPNFGFPHKYSWSTSGRTDKGVHACAQVISGKLLVEQDETYDDIRKRINSYLPHEGTNMIQILDIKRTTRSFCAKTYRSKVQYTYMIPAYVFYDRTKLRQLFEEIAPFDDNRHPMKPLEPKEVGEILQHLRKFRVSQDQIQQLDTVLQQYQGTHDFFNFTKNLKRGDASSKRYIVSFRVEQNHPLLLLENDNDKNDTTTSADNNNTTTTTKTTQWIPTQVLGQSFLLHQIRKMIALGCDVVRGNACLETMKQLLRPTDENEHMRTPLAPSQGLFLEKSIYDGYNNTLGKKNQVKEGETLEEIFWKTTSDDDSTENDDTADVAAKSESSSYQRWKSFRNDHVMKHIVQEEELQGNFVQYLYQQEYYFKHEEYYQLPDDDNKTEKESDNNKNTEKEKEK